MSHDFKEDIDANGNIDYGRGVNIKGDINKFYSKINNANVKRLEDIPVYTNKIIKIIGEPVLKKILEKKLEHFISKNLNVFDKIDYYKKQKEALSKQIEILEKERDQNV